MTAEEKDLQEQLAPLGLPDDLDGVVLQRGPAPDPQAVERIRQMTLARVTAPPANKPRRAAIWAAAAALVLISLGITATVGPAQVWARFLNYVPGFGAREHSEVTLAAARPVRVDQSGRWVEVRGLMADNRGISLRLTTMGVPIDFERVSLETPDGKSLVLRSGNYSTGGQNYDGWFWLQDGRLDPTARSVTVVVRGDPDWRIPLDLVPGSELQALDQFGPTATVQGYRLAARLHSYADRSDLTVLSAGPDGTRVIGLGRSFRDLPANRPLTLSAPGWDSEPSSRGGTALELWHYEAGPVPGGVESVRLTVPAIEVQVQGKGRVTLDVATGPVEKTVQVGDWPVRIIRTEVVGDGLEIWVDPGPAGPQYLDSFRFERKGMPVPGAWRVNAVSGRLEWISIPLEPGEKKRVTLTLVAPRIVVEGPWVIDVPANR